MCMIYMYMCMIYTLGGCSYLLIVCNVLFVSCVYYVCICMYYVYILLLETPLQWCAVFVIAGCGFSSELAIIKSLVFLRKPFHRQNLKHITFSTKRARLNRCFLSHCARIFKMSCHFCSRSPKKLASSGKNALSFTFPWDCPSPENVWPCRCSAPNSAVIWGVFSMGQCIASYSTKAKLNLRENGLFNKL